MSKQLKFIISGGGTGGHIFPAISIANAIKSKEPDSDILFVGAEGRMEMQRVPAAGYPIKGLPVSGFDRKRLWRNFAVLWKLWKSQRLAKRIIREFGPHAAVGVGGYASGPTINKCADMGIPCLIQEQNSYAGVTNKLLAKKAKKICVAYDGMERFFPSEKIENLGNPVRQSLMECTLSREEAARLLGLDPSCKILLIVGGSLGARTLNESVLQHLEEIQQSSIEVLWQTGKYYHSDIMQQLEGRQPDNLKVTDFISDMAAAYRAADLVVSRAGASSISEFCLLGMPVILVPSPNVAENHQYHNAMALVKREAAIHISDAEAPKTLISTAVATINDQSLLRKLASNVKQLAKYNSAEEIADRVIDMAKQFIQS